jgi:hypothetical protein
VSPEKQRIAIATALGWTEIHCGDSQFPSHLVGLPPGAIKPIDSRPVPRFPDDLNAMHAAWMTLSNDDKISCAQWLMKLCGIDSRLLFDIGVPMLLDDLLKFWPEAYLRTVGKWVNPSLDTAAWVHEPAGKDSFGVAYAEFWRRGNETTTKRPPVLSVSQKHDPIDFSPSPDASVFDSEDRIKE